MSETEFETRIQNLISEARNRSAPLYGAYSIRSPDPDIQDYEVLITEVANASDFRLFGDSNE